METSPGSDFIRSQDEEIRAFHKDYYDHTKSFADAVRADRPRAEQIELLLKLHSVGSAYHRRVESSVFDRDSLQGEDYRRWVNEWTVSARKTLSDLPRYYENLREQRDRLNLPESMFEPPAGSHENLQRFFAAACDRDVAALKERLLQARIPVAGFDHPYMPKASFDSSWWRPFVWVAVVVALAVAFIVGAHYVHPVLLLSIIGAVMALLVIISAVELKRQDKLKDKSFVDLIRLALAKRFHFLVGRQKDRKP